jgi:hypothetical protein
VLRWARLGHTGHPIAQKGKKIGSQIGGQDKQTLSRRILDFQNDSQETAKPFDWRFTAADLKERLDALKDFAAARLYPGNV